MSKVRLTGTTSGFTEITAPATAGNNTITLPSSNGSANQLLKNSGTAGTLEFASNVVIDSNDRLGIGTTAPSHRLEVARLGADLDIPGVDANTTILATAGGGVASSGAAITLAGGNTSATSVYFGDTDNGGVGGLIYNHNSDALTFRTAGANIGAFDSSGRLVLGGITPQTSVACSICTTGRIESDATYSNTTAAAANVVIDVNGLFVRSTSSIKYKTDIEDVELSYSEALVYGSRPVWYRSLCEDDPDENSYWGFIAEEVAELDPRMVHWGADGPEGVQYDRYVVHLVNVIQQQKQQLDALEARLAALEANP